MSLNVSHPAFAKGRTAVVTGAASGIGLAAAIRFASLGMRVCLADWNAEGLEAAARQVTDAAAGGSGDVFAQRIDVSSAAEVDRLAAAVFGRFGEVGVLINNAATNGGGDALSNPEGWQRVLGANLMGVVNGVQRFAPQMIAQATDCVVVNTGSKQGITSPPGDTAYNVSKAGVKALTEGLAHSLRNTPGCKVSAHLLIPGFTYTGMTGRRFTEKPLGAWTPDQVIDRMIEGIQRDEFYILCQDNETTRDQDDRRILWAAGDIVQNRPALSRWHPDYKDAFDAFMKAGS